MLFARAAALVLVAVVAGVAVGCGSSHSAKPAVAIDGTIVFTSPHEGRAQDIYLLDAEGTQTLASNGLLNMARPAWSPDGTRIVYMTDTNQLAVVKRDGSGGTLLTPKTSDPSLFPARPDWLPNGSISFVAAGKLAEVRPDGSGVRVLTPRWFTHDYFTAYAWAPNGRQLVYDCSVVTSGRICLYDAKTGRSQALLKLPAPAHALDWSPDGTQIVASNWAGAQPYGALEDIQVFNANGHGLHALARPGKEEDAAWSPDGKQLVYTSWPENPEGASATLWVMNADGTGAQELLPPNGKVKVTPDWTNR